MRRSTKGKGEEAPNYELARAITPKPNSEIEGTAHIHKVGPTGKEGSNSPSGLSGLLVSQPPARGGGVGGRRAC